MEEIELSADAQREQAELRKSSARIRAERADLDAQNEALRSLIKREEALAAHLREVIADAKAERQAIDAEKSSILSPAGR
jgi:chromosome segregation ATPase